MCIRDSNGKARDPAADLRVALGMQLDQVTEERGVRTADALTRLIAAQDALDEFLCRFLRGKSTVTDDNRLTLAHRNPPACDASRTSSPRRRRSRGDVAYRRVARCRRCIVAQTCFLLGSWLLIASRD